MSARPLPVAAEAAVPAATPGRVHRFAPLAAFAASHVVLALAMQAAPVVATFHALACLAVGLYIAARRRIQETAFVVAYIVGSEVLWRMTRAGVFWEYGKYAISAVLFVALLRIRLRRNVGVALTYLGVLLPSALLTVLTLHLDIGRQQLSFNLSGPLCLTLCVLYFSNVQLGEASLRTTMLALIAPVIGIGTIAYYSTATAVDLEFVGESNSVTSGGFGPNQVSAMLGLALLFALLLVLERRVALRVRVPLLLLVVVFAAQAALTFSRGGLAVALASAFAAIFYLVRDTRTRATLVVLGVLLFAAGKYIVVPQLEVFTAGALGERYTNVDPSGRGVLASFDLQIFADHPVLGVGPGVAPGIREELGHGGAAHTEFTRMLAEHGMLGVLAIGALIVLGIRAVAGARTLRARAYVVAMLVWVTLFLLVNAMRLAAPAFMFGLACSVSYASLLVARPRPNLPFAARLRT
ncbi:MAG TPA: O-antigen ligase family protein [Kofleriaceae bacterium]|nr:O-antigen ligase family protein [Kofleriaceae bacterium]